MFLIIRPLRLLLKALVTDARPGHLALGFAFGILIGLVPKGNLLAIGLGVIMTATRANLGVAAATILCVSLASPLLDGGTHALGHWLLSRPQLSTIWTWLYNQPVIPWTDFNNTVVLGSFVVGLVATYPAYRYSKRFFKTYSEQFAERARKYWLTRVLFGAEWADRLGTST